MNPDWIADRELTAVVPEEGTRTVRLLIGRPSEDERCDWKCATFIQGLDDKPMWTFGVDALQALLLALRYQRANVEWWMAGGVTFHWLNESAPVSVAELFSIVDCAPEP